MYEVDPFLSQKLVYFSHPHLLRLLVCSRKWSKKMFFLTGINLNQDQAHIGRPYRNSRTDTSSKCVMPKKTLDIFPLRSVVFYKQIYLCNHCFSRNCTLCFPLFDVGTWVVPLLLISTWADIWPEVCDRLPGKEQRWQLQTLGEHFRGVAEVERGDAAAQEDRTDAFTVLAGVINTLSSAFPIKCALTPGNNFPLMWQHGTNRKHPWKKQPTHTSFKWPQLSSRDYKVCVCVSIYVCVCASGANVSGSRVGERPWPSLSGL